MPETILLKLLLVLGFVVLACAVMAILAWVGVWLLRRHDQRRTPNAEHAQSRVVANGLFELGETTREPQAPMSHDRRRGADEIR